MDNEGHRHHREPLLLRPRRVPFEARDPARQAHRLHRDVARDLLAVRRGRGSGAVRVQRLDDEVRVEAMGRASERATESDTTDSAPRA